MFHPTMSKSGRILFWPVIKLFEWMGEHHPVSLVKIRYFMRFHRMPNLKDPKDLNEKILYLKLFSDTSKWTELADKYKVREYVKMCGLEEILIPFIGMWTNVADIDFKSLPNSYIFKANNGDGKNSNLIVKDNKSLNIEETKTLLKGWLGKKHVGALAAEPQYSKMSPCIIAEELLPIEVGNKSLIDYKIWCFNGEPYSILTCSNRNGEKVCLGCYDLNWTYCPQNMIESENYPFEEHALPRPACLEQMLVVAKKLSSGFPEVRVDLYEAGGKIYFGELTFTSLGGMMYYYTPEYLLEMGKKVKLPKN